jgi:hypothetical protein
VFQTKTSVSLCLTVFAALLSILCSGCGGNSSSMNNSMSQAQAQAVSDQISQAIAQALGTTVPAIAPATSDARPSLSTAVGHIRPDESGGCTPTSTGQNCNFPISLTGYPCGAQGGTISVTGDFSGTLNNSGAGSISGQLAITPAECSVSNLVLNGDPSIDVSGQVNFSNDETPVFPVTFTETGGISYGPNPSGTCQLNATYTINSLTSCTVTGTVCGQSVNGSC